MTPQGIGSQDFFLKSFCSVNLGVSPSRVFALCRVFGRIVTNELHIPGKLILQGISTPGSLTRLGIMQTPGSHVLADFIFILYLPLTVTCKNLRRGKLTPRGGLTPLGD